MKGCLRAATPRQIYTLCAQQLQGLFSSAEKVGTYLFKNLSVHGFYKTIVIYAKNGW